MEAINYKLDVFEGPLDLLLHLISKHKLNINDIPIFELVEQYTNYVRLMEEADMEIASDFLEMAARLVYIKTVSLLPKQEQAEELKRELTGELIEYRDCKMMAQKIAENADGFDYFYRQTMKIETSKKYERIHEKNELLYSYITAIGRTKNKLPPPIEAFTEIVSKKIVSVASRVGNIVTKLKKGTKRKFLDFFTDAKSSSEMVATFLAMLELIKANKIKVEGEQETMQVVRVESDDEMFSYNFTEFDEENEENQILNSEKESNNE